MKRPFGSVDIILFPNPMDKNKPWSPIYRYIFLGMKAVMYAAWKMGKENFFIQMVLFMKANGKVECDSVVGNTRTQMETGTMETGKTTRKMDMEFIMTKQPIRPIPVRDLLLSFSIW